MLDIDYLFQTYDPMSIRDLKKENYLAKKNISSLKFKKIKQKQEPFGFLFEKPPKTEPSILRQANIIEIIESSPKIEANEKKSPLFYDVDESIAKKLPLDPEDLQQKIQKYMNMNLNSMITDHNEEVHDIIFDAPEEAVFIEYFPN